MKRALLVLTFSQGRTGAGAAAMGIAVLLMLTTARTSYAQDAGVSGIPPGPANARGLNGSVNDPSGIGNAARVPAIPPPATSPVPVPGAAPSAYRPSSYRASQTQRVVRTKRTRFATPRSRRAATRAEARERAEVRENDRLLGRMPSICRGC